jgi:hypothetical protein
MKTYFPSTGSDVEWNAAYYRLEDYLRALHVVNKVDQSQIILRVLRSAAARHALNPALNPTTLAMDEMCAAMDTWFKKIEPEKDAFSTSGRVAFLITDAPERWPHAFLSDKIPPELELALRESEVQAGPDLQISSMVPRPMDLPAPELPSPAAWEKGNLFLPLLAMVAVLVFLVFLFS